jgi:general secretion pathway protein G
MGIQGVIALACDRPIVEAMSSNPSALRVRRNISPSEQGLTLIEMIVVLAIIALVAAIIVPSVIGRPDQARVTVAQTDLRNISAALKIYRLDNGDYPSTAQGLAALAAKPSGEPVPRNWNSGGYLDAVPVDPWGNPYGYRSPGENSASFDLLSTGKDGKPGGEGLDADLKISGR